MLLLLLSYWQGVKDLCIIAGETREDQMEEGDLEALGTSIPEELAEFVSKDNEAFIQECDQWDKAQEDRKKQEALAMVKKQQHPETAAADSSNDIEVSASHFSSTGGCSSGAIFAFQYCTRMSKVTLTLSNPAEICGEVRHHMPKSNAKHEFS